jgi:hypothetical protein
MNIISIVITIMIIAYKDRTLFHYLTVIFLLSIPHCLFAPPLLFLSFLSPFLLIQTQRKVCISRLCRSWLIGKFVKEYFLKIPCRLITNIENIKSMNCL